MKREDIDFRKNCQKYHNSVRKLLKQGKIRESNELINEIANSLRQWEEHKRSVYIRINALKSLYAAATLEQKRAIEKTISIKKVSKMREVEEKKAVEEKEKKIVKTGGNENNEF